VLDGLPPVSLDVVEGAAALQSRRDRKYVVDPGLVDRLLADVPDGVQVLDIDGRRLFAYESRYLDTVDLVSYRAAAHRRRRRFKVRFRHYVDADDHTLEVKLRAGRGRNEKLRLPVDPPADGLPDDAGRRFVDDLVGAGTTATLRPVLTTRYHRATLVDLADPAAPARLTIDRDVVCTSTDGASTTVTGVVLETKTAGPPCRFDRWLWTHGVRPLRLSKYCTGLAALRPALPSNKWHRTLVRHLG